MRRSWITAGLTVGLVIVGAGAGARAMQARGAAAADPPVSSYLSVTEDDFRTVLTRMRAAKASIEQRHQALLAARYDLADRPVAGATMSRGKPIQGGVRVKLPSGVTWDALARMSPDEIRGQDAFPAGLMPLPHPNHPEGGMVFPKFLIEETRKQTGRDLTRFDLDFDLPDRFLPEFPSPIYLTTRPDLGDVSRGQLVTISNFYELFNGILNPKQLEGLRLLVTPFPQQQFMPPPIAVASSRASAWPASIAIRTATPTARPT